MEFRRSIPIIKTTSTWFIGSLIAVFALINFTARANVYATNIKLDGSLANAVFAYETDIQISYLLNEAATAGVVIEIFSGATVARTWVIAPGNAGTLRGSNAVVWDGKNNSDDYVGAGIYAVRITAGANGYGGWTQISQDAAPGNYVFEPRGIAVNQNTNSPFYGRVFVSNAHANPGGIAVPGDQVGILKANADGSFADEGGFSTGGYPWAGDYFSPWKMEISTDDKLYVSDWTGNGNVMAFDQLISSNYSMVLRNDNNPNGVANLSGPFITGGGTNTKVFMADINYTAPATGTGITRWNVGANGACAANDTGTQMVKAVFGSDLDIYPYDVAVDKNGKIYTIQYRSSAGDPAFRVMRFPAYSGTPSATADWKIGSADNSLRQASGIAVDPTGTYVAVALQGVFGDGGIALFDADTGDLIARDFAQLEDHRDVAWDNVGNLYVVDNADSFWRAYSPPGANQSTTIALPTILVGESLILSEPNWSAGNFQFTLKGKTNQTYIIERSTNLSNWSPVATNLDAAAVRTINLPTASSNGFYRAVSAP